jgi:hypothetical protein
MLFQAVLARFHTNPIIWFASRRHLLAIVASSGIGLIFMIIGFFSFSLNRLLREGKNSTEQVNVLSKRRGCAANPVRREPG